MVRIVWIDVIIVKIMLYVVYNMEIVMIVDVLILVNNFYDVKV